MDENLGNGTLQGKQYGDGLLPGELLRKDQPAAS